MRDFLPIHVDEVPDYEVRGDCIVLCWRGLEVFVPVPICQAAVGRCNRALDQWYESKGVVTPIRHRMDIAAE